jgi:hypothetical protein
MQILKLVQTGQLYWAFPFSKTSLISVISAQCYYAECRGTDLKANLQVWQKQSNFDS